MNTKESPVLGLSEFKKKFDVHLRDFLRKKLSHSALITSNASVLEIVEHIFEISESGKRIRPYLAYLGYISSGGIVKRQMFDACVGIELFHVFALIHDDIMDCANERHGISTIHSFTLSLFQSRFVKDMQHVAESQAILAGDLVHVWAHEALFSSVPLENQKDVQKIFYEMIHQVIIGQMIDIDISTCDVVSFENLEEKNCLKTARYTCVHPLLMGLALSGKIKNKKIRSLYEDMGESIGSAFQIQDDLLDIIGDPQKTGKRTFSDIEESQHTHFTNHVFVHGSQKDILFLRSRFGKKLSEKDRETLHMIFKESGAIEYGRLLIKNKIDLAYKNVEKSLLSENHKQAFISFIHLLEHRIS